MVVGWRRVGSALRSRENVRAMCVYLVWWIRSLPGEYLKLAA